MESCCFSRQATSTTGAPRRLRGWRRVGFPLAAIILGAVPWIVLEISLALCDVANPLDERDPAAGFGGQQPLFELDADAAVYRTARCRQLHFGPQEFAQQKPRGLFGFSAWEARPFAGIRSRPTPRS